MTSTKKKKDNKQKKNKSKDTGAVKDRYQKARKKKRIAVVHLLPLRNVKKEKKKAIFVVFLKLVFL